MRFPRITPKRVTLLTIGVAALAVVGYALATPPAPSHIYRGTLVQRIHANADHIKLHTDATTDIAGRDLTFLPGDSSGWHTHSGVVVVEVEGPSGGYLTHHNGCAVSTLSNGQAFSESGDTPGLVENTSGITMTVHATFIVPTGAPLTTGTGPPSC